MPLTTVQLGMQGTPQFYGFKNRIINGGMTINQRGASGTIVTGTYLADRWGVFQDTTATLTYSQSTVAPAGFTNSSLITVTSTGTVTSGQANTIRQSIEGFNCADLGWGTANAQTVTLSFWVRSSVTGTFGGSITNSGNTRSNPFSYTISAANTWEQKSVTISGDTTGTWLTNNGIGITVWFSIGAGSTLSGPTGSWAGVNYVSATGATNIVGTSGATWQITGVQLEAGVTATSFDYRAYGQELVLCQRYFESFAYPEVAVAAGVPNTLKYSFSFAVTKRVAPNMTLPASTNQGLNRTNGATLTPGFAWAAGSTVSGFQIYAGDSNIGGFVSGTATASAEL